MRHHIANKTDVLRFQVAKKVFGELDNGDGVRDIPSWEIFEKTLDLQQENAQLKEENRVLDLALNNLLKMYKKLFDKRFDKIIETKSIEYIRQQLLRQAKEMLNEQV